jgi:hypothetical protein
MTNAHGFRDVTEDIANNLRLIPSYKPFNLTSGIDRYGFSSILCEQMGLKRRPRSFANWLHGWIWWGATSSAELMFDCAQKQGGRFIVSKSLERGILEAEGFQNVWVGGLPFAYTLPSNLKRIGGSLLAMPPHSGESEKLGKSHVDYLDYLESIKRDFSSIWVCIHYLDISLNVVNEIKSRGLFLIEGARPDDANSLRRMRAIFDSFEYVTSSVMGSHIVYSMYSGCKVSLCGPVYVFSESDVIFDKYRHAYGNNFIRDWLYYSSKGYLNENFHFLFAENPRDGYQSDEYARIELGYYNKLSRREIVDALRWDISGQLIGYSSGAIRRLSRALPKILGHPASISNQSIAGDSKQGTDSN